jgi:hypothetical protein
MLTNPVALLAVLALVFAVVGAAFGRAAILVPVAIIVLAIAVLLSTNT